MATSSQVRRTTEASPRAELQAQELRTVAVPPAWHQCSSAQALELWEQHSSNPRLWDVTLEAGDGVRVHANSLDLCASSAYFNAALLRGERFADGAAQQQHQQQQQCVLRLQETAGDTVREVVRSLYAAEVRLSKLTAEPVLALACRLQLEGVRAACCQYLKDLIPQHALDVWITADKYACHGLRDAAHAGLVAAPMQLLLPHLYGMPTEVLALFLADDRLVLAEWEVHHAVVMWWLHWGRRRETLPFEPRSAKRAAAASSAVEASARAQLPAAAQAAQQPAPPALHPAPAHPAAAAAVAAAPAPEQGDAAAVGMGNPAAGAAAPCSNPCSAAGTAATSPPAAPRSGGADADTQPATGEQHDAGEGCADEAGSRPDLAALLARVVRYEHMPLCDVRSILLNDTVRGQAGVQRLLAGHLLSRAGGERLPESPVDRPARYTCVEIRVEDVNDSYLKRCFMPAHFKINGSPHLWQLRLNVTPGDQPQEPANADMELFVVELGPDPNALHLISWRIIHYAPGSRKTLGARPTGAPYAVTRDGGVTPVFDLGSFQRLIRKYAAKIGDKYVLTVCFRNEYPITVDAGA